MEPLQILPFRVRVDMGIMAMKGPLRFPKFQDWSHTILSFSVLPKTLVGEGGDLLLRSWRVVSVFYSISRLDENSS